MGYKTVQEALLTARFRSAYIERRDCANAGRDMAQSGDVAFQIGARCPHQERPHFIMTKLNKAEFSPISEKRASVT
jgi:hypothetical protein